MGTKNVLSMMQPVLLEWLMSKNTSIGTKSIAFRQTLVMSTSGFRMHTGCTEFQSNSCPPTVDIAAFRVVSDYTCLIYQYYDSNLKPLDQYFNYIPARTIPNILLNFDNAVVILRPYSVNLSFMHGCTLSSNWHEPGVNLPVLELYHLFRLLLNTKSILVYPVSDFDQILVVVTCQCVLHVLSMNCILMKPL